MHQIQVGTTGLTGSESAATLSAHRFNRHTFWCGQSGSGKTYALGVVLEQLLLHTGLPLLVLDPNGDFVHLGESVEGADAHEAALLAERDIRVLRSGDVAGPRVHIRFTGLQARSKAAVLQLDPVVDEAEYNVLLHLEHESGGDHRQFMTRLRASQDRDQQKLLRRIENLGVLEWDVWAWGGPSLEDLLEEPPEATVLEVGGFSSRQQATVAALGALDWLWDHRDRRQPLLIVMDEAHNFCPQSPTTPVERALTERIVQIAAEGRKYGLWLLLCTQQPSKVHANAVSQCDNLCVLKMSSPRDVEELRGLFGFVPADLLTGSSSFVQGTALFAGGFVERPSVVRMRRRLTREGGSDVAVPMRPAPSRDESPRVAAVP